jgi:S-formylglutathione hydrolase FrmB
MVRIRANVVGRSIVSTSLVTLALLAAGGAGPAQAAASASGTATFGTTCVSRPTPLPSDTTLSHVTSVAHGRLRTYTVTSPAVGVTHVNVLLPVHYRAASAQRYPVLYLLHGALSSYADWASTAKAGGVAQGGDVESLVGDLPIIVVMPDDSPSGSYTDWYGISARDAAANPAPAAPAWETYDINELIPWVDATFSAQDRASGRAIAGLSSGGGGAAKYATAHPGLFGFVGTFSGAVDNNLIDATINWYTESNILDGSGSPDQHCTFGDPFTTDAQNQVYQWFDNDPTYEASNLDGVKLFVASGNGTPTSADAPTNPGLVGILGLVELVVDDMSHHFVAAVHSAGLGANVTTDFYGNGIHAWYYWQHDLTSFLNWLRPQLNRPPVRLTSFSFRTARSTSSAWGWTFHYDSGLSVPNVNTAEEFVYLTHLSSRGFAAAGNGALRVLTPKGSYRAGSAHQIHVGGTTMTVTANRSGQLRFSVAIGPPAVAEQVDFPASGPPIGMPTIAVTIR